MLYICFGWPKKDILHTGSAPQEKKWISEPTGLINTIISLPTIFISSYIILSSSSAPQENLPDGRDPKGRSKWQRRNWKPWMMGLEEWGELVERVHWSEIHRIFVNDLKSNWSNISFKFCWILVKRNPGFRDTCKRSALPWWCLIMLDTYWWWFWRRIFGWS